MPTTVKPAVDEKAVDTSVEEGRDDERATAERSDVAKEMMSATASSRKKWTSLTPAIGVRRRHRSVP